MTAKYLMQGVLDFSVGYKLQTRWGASEAAVFTLECAGVALASATLVAAPSSVGFAVGLAMVALAVGLLFAHLGQPSRAWRAVLAFGTSWISRGTLALGCFLAFGVLHLATGSGDTPLRALEWALLALAAFILFYPGLVLAASPAIPFWNSALLPVISAVSGAASGLTIYLLVDPRYAWIAFGLLAALAVLVSIYLAVMLREGGAAGESAGLALGRQSALFLGAGCGLGLALPLALVLWVAAGEAGMSAVLAAAVCRIVGDFAMRLAWLKVGLFSPVS